MKKILSLTLALALCLGLCAFPASAADGDFTIEDGVLTKYNGPGGDVVIPDDVTSVGEYAFFRCEDLTSVIIPSSVTDIGEYAFGCCFSLTNVTIPSNVTNIERGTFESCTSLTSVTIPSSVTSIEVAAFVNCTSLTSVNIPSGVTSIGMGVFTDCTSLTSVTIPHSVTRIGGAVFGGCTSLTDIYYTGTKPQWDAIQIDEVDENFASARIHYAADDQQGPPAVTVENIPSSGTAYASTQTVLVDGSAVEFQMYALLDENGNGTNYIKLRDLAYVLNGTSAQFAVGYDGTISLTTGQSYAVTGTEMTTPFSGDRAYTGGTQSIKIDSKTVDLTAITLVDDAGGGYNYFKLRDLGKALGFNVGYRAGQGVFLESGEPYSDAD